MQISSTLREFVLYSYFIHFVCFPALPLFRWQPCLHNVFIATNVCFLFPYAFGSQVLLSEWTVECFSPPIAKFCLFAITYFVC